MTTGMACSATRRRISSGDIPRNSAARLTSIKFECQSSATAEHRLPCDPPDVGDGVLLPEVLVEPVVDSCELVEQVRGLVVQRRGDEPPLARRMVLADGKLSIVVRG